MEWPPRVRGPMPKPSRLERRLSRTREQRDIAASEKREKAKVRRRDRACRFPLCPCRRLGLALHASHQDHKGMGGDRLGLRTTADQMILLCAARHKEAAFSVHNKNLRAVYLTPDRADGPIGWEIEIDGQFQPLAREDRANGPWVMDDHQREMAEALARSLKQLLGGS